MGRMEEVGDVPDPFSTTTFMYRFSFKVRFKTRRWISMYDKIQFVGKAQIGIYLHNPNNNTIYLALLCIKIIDWFSYELKHTHKKNKHPKPEFAQRSSPSVHFYSSILHLGISASCSFQVCPCAPSDPCNWSNSCPHQIWNTDVCLQNRPASSYLKACITPRLTRLTILQGTRKTYIKSHLCSGTRVIEWTFPGCCETNNEEQPLHQTLLAHNNLVIIQKCLLFLY